jgi:hypothetical protein
MSVLELNGRVFDASTTGTLTLTSEGGNATTDVTQGLVKGWINLDGSGTIGISDSNNVGSVTDNSTGNYTVTFSNAMSNSLYATAGIHSANSSFDANFRALPNATTNMLFHTQAGGAVTDPDIVTALAAGDLA